MEGRCSGVLFEPVHKVVLVLVGHEGQLAKEVGKNDICTWCPELGILSTVGRGRGGGGACDRYKQCWMMHVQ